MSNSDAETDLSQAQPQQGGLATVGSQLAAAREKQRLNLDAVAAELHLRPEVVRALETGDEGRLPAIAFIRGYVKSYARLLGLDETALVAQLPKPSEQQPEPLKTIGIRRRRKLSFPLGKWLAWGLSVFALVIIVVYAVPMVERLWSARTTQAPVADHLLLAPAGSGETADDAATTMEIPPLVESELDEDVPLEPAPAETTADATVDEKEPVVEQPVVESSQPTEPDQGPAIVQLRFAEDSWVEMEANGRKLVVGIQRAGTERTVRAEPPVQLLLGNAAGVEVIYRGKPVDLASYRRGKVARLTLED